MLNKRKLRMMIHTVTFSLLACMYISCNDSMERLLQDQYPESGTQLHSGKVMLIVIDGASGSAINEAYNSRRAPNIRSMRDNSLITFEGLADSRHDNLPVFTNERGWASMMTGVTTHGIGLEEPGGEPRSIETLETPTFLQRIKEVDANKRISLYASDDDFYQAFGKDADILQRTNTDQEVKDVLFGEIGSDEDALSDIIVVQFSSVQRAGLVYGFADQSNTPTGKVLEAIETIDGYIGEIRTVLESRESYKEENWLIIVTTTYGGIYTETKDGKTYYDDPRLNTFTMMYNYSIESNVLTKPGSGELRYNYFTPIYTSLHANSYAEVIDPSLFDMDPTKSYTVQFMFYSSGRHLNSEMLISKTNRYTGENTSGNRGWSIRGNNWSSGRIYFVVGARIWWTYQSTLELDPRIGTDGNWHTVTMVVNTTTNRVQCYVNGKNVIHNNHVNDVLNPANLSCPEFPLRIGYRENSPLGTQLQFSITNLQFYDIALPVEYISANYGLTQLQEIQNEYWDNLIGYWPCDREEDYKQSVLKDYSQYAASREGKSDMVFKDKSWIDGSSVEENVFSQPDASYYRRVVNNVDIPFQAMQWLGIPISLQWEFEGNVRPFRYTYMENN